MMLSEKGNYKNGDGSSFDSLEQKFTGTHKNVWDRLKKSANKYMVKHLIYA